MSFSGFKRRLRRNLPPLPQIRSPRQIWRWIKARPRRYRTFKRLAVLAVIGLIGWAVARPTFHAIKGWQARRLAREASQLVEKEDWKNANRKIQDAFQLWYNEPQVWRAEAQLLGRIGQNHNAVRWWQRVADSQPLSVPDRRDYAMAALGARDLTTAEEQVNQLLANNPNPAAPDLVLAGMLASLHNLPNRAVDYGNKVLRDPAAGDKEKIEAASVVLSNAATDSADYRQAYENLVSIGRGDDDDIATLNALTILARQPRPTSSETARNVPLQNAAADGTTMPAIEMAERLDRHHKSRAFHKILALEVRARTDPEQAGHMVDQAIQRFRNGDDETVTRLGTWLYTRGEFEAMLKVLPIERATRSRELFIQRLGALAHLKRYDELEEMLLSEQSVIDPSMQHMFLAVAKTMLGETVASNNEWQRALDEADNLPKLLALADYAEKNGALETADAAYGRAISKDPGLRAAYHARLRLAETLGETSKAHQLTKEIVRLWPDDTATRVREIYLRLLLNTSATDARAAEKEINAILSRTPKNEAAATALALARLRQGRVAAALEAAPQPGPGVSPSAPLAVAWAENGWKDLAREEVKKLETVKLLPEERALINGLGQ